MGSCISNALSLLPIYPNLHPKTLYSHPIIDNDNFLRFQSKCIFSSQKIAWQNLKIYSYYSSEVNITYITYVSG